MTLDWKNGNNMQIQKTLTHLLFWPWPWVSFQYLIHNLRGFCLLFNKDHNLKSDMTFVCVFIHYYYCCLFLCPSKRGMVLAIEMNFTRLKSSSDLLSAVLQHLYLLIHLLWMLPTPLNHELMLPYTHRNYFSFWHAKCRYSGETWQHGRKL